MRGTIVYPIRVEEQWLVQFEGINSWFDENEKIFHTDIVSIKEKDLKLIKETP